MPIPTYVGVVPLGSSSASSLTPDVSGIDGGSPPSEGDLLIANLGVEGSVSTSNYAMQAPGDWHHVGGAQNSCSSAIYWKIWSVGDDTTPTFSGWPTGHCAISVHCVRGADQARPIARHSINRETSTNYTWIPEETPVDNCLAIAFGVVDDNVAGFTPASGWTERVDGVVGTALAVYVQSQGFSTAGTSTGNAQVSRGGVTDQGIEHMILIQEDQAETPLDVRVKTGSLSSPTATGNQDVTGLGFDCKALIIYGARINADSVASDIEYMRGIGADDGVSPSSQRAVGIWHDSGTTTNQGYGDNGSIVKFYFTGNSTLGSPDLEATFSRIADGFRLNWSAVDATTGYTFNWIAIGGDDVEAVVGSEQVSTSPVSGLPWRPDMVHTLSQCVDNDTEQIRAFGLMSSGWLDCQSGGQWASIADPDSGASTFVVRQFGFVAQIAGGGLTWEAGFEQTTADGWSWSGSNTDHFFYLALHFQNDTAFPVQVETVQTDQTGIAGANQTLPSFARGQANSVKQLVHVFTGDDTMETDSTAGGLGEGHVEFDGGSGFARDQDALNNARTGNTSERRRKPLDAILIPAAGDLDSPGKVGRFVDEDTIEWSANNVAGYFAGLATIGFVGQEHTENPTDSVSTTDNLGVSLFFGRADADTATATDSASRGLGASRVITDAMSAADSVATKSEQSRAVDDSVSVVDAVAKEHTAVRQQSDSVAAVDAVSTSQGYSRVTSDFIEVSDQNVVGRELERLAGDFVGTTDAADVEFTEGGALVEDTIGVADFSVAGLEFGRFATDSIDVEDGASTEGIRSIFDVVGVSDFLVSETGFERGAVDTASVLDVISVAVEVVAADSAAATDTLAREHDATRVLLDVVSTVDQVSISVDTKTEDSVGVADAVFLSVERASSASDGVGAADTVSSTLEFARFASESVSVDDEAVTESNYERSTVDSAETSDETARALVMARAVSDVVAVTDRTNAARVVVVADALDVADVLTREHAAVRTAADVAAASDTTVATTAGLFGVILADAVGAADAIALEAEFPRAVADALGAVDATAVEIQFGRSAADTTAAADAVATSRELARSATDIASASDDTTREHGAARSVTDALGVADSLATEAGALLVITDALVATDTLAREHDASRDVADVAETADLTTAGLDRERTTADATALSDLISVEANFSRTATDSAVAADALAREHDAVRAATDAIATTDESASGQSFQAFVLDNVGSVDTVAASSDYARASADVLSALDTLTREQEASRAVSDSVGTNDITFGGEFALVVDDAVAITDALAREHDSARAATDSVAVVDAAESAEATGVEATDSVGVTDATSVEADFLRTAGDSVDAIGAVEVLFVTLNVVIVDSASIVDVADGSLEVAATPADVLAVSDVLGVVLTLGASASDVLVVSDALGVDVLNLDSDALEVVDSVLRAVEYVREIGNAVGVSDLAIEGEPEVYGETIDGAVVVGAVDAYTVSPFGPVAAGGGPDCVTAPVGFLVRAIDQVSCTDSFRAGLECHVAIGDVVNVVEV